MSPRNQDIATAVVEPLIGSIHTLLPLPSMPEATIGTLPAILDRAIAAREDEHLTALARAFPGAYAFFYTLGCDAEDAGAFDDADRHFVRAAALLEHLEDRLPSEDALLAGLKS